MKRRRRSWDVVVGLAQRARPLKVGERRRVERHVRSAVAGRLVRIVDEHVLVERQSFLVLVHGLLEFALGFVDLGDVQVTVRRAPNIVEPFEDLQRLAVVAQAFVVLTFLLGHIAQFGVTLGDETVVVVADR